MYTKNINFVALEFIDWRSNSIGSEISSSKSAQPFAKTYPTNQSMESPHPNHTYQSLYEPNCQQMKIFQTPHKLICYKNDKIC